MVTAVVGANWGDEGKGKITDMLAQQADIVIRYQGGANAGHTIKNEYGKFALHTLPSGAFSKGVVNVIGNGVALNVRQVLKEIREITEKGVPAPNLLISDRAQIVMSYHVLFDSLEEARLAGKSFGSTRSGIAPFFSDKFAKTGIQVSELADMDALREKVEGLLVQKNLLLTQLYHQPELKTEDIMQELAEYKELLAPYVCDTSAYLWQALKEGKNILLEGQLGTMKDPDHGIYPMVTSSSPLAGYGAVGAGIPPYEIRRIIAGRRPTSSATGAATAANTALPPDGPAASVSTTWSPPATAAACRERPRSPSRSSTCSAISMRSPSARATRSTER